MEGAWVITNGKIKDANTVPTMSCESHYTAGCNAFEAGDWGTAERHFSIVSLNFPNSTWGPESAFFLGAALFETQEFEAANESFSNYLKMSCQPKYFNPRWTIILRSPSPFVTELTAALSARENCPNAFRGRNLAVMIFDEIIQAMPCHDYAAQSYWMKGKLLWKMEPILRRLTPSRD